MSTYKNLIGKDVNFLTTDLDNVQAEGQIWYNSTLGVFKDAITHTAFSAGANLSTSRSDFRGTFGTQSAFKGAGGFTTLPPGNTPAITTVEDYDGTGFSTATALPLATRNQAGGGTQTAGWVAGGRRYPTSPSNTTDTTVDWDGSSWTSSGALGSAKYGNSGTGTATAGLSSGGYSTTNLNETEEYNGSSWSEQNNMGTARYRTAATGTQTATILFGGDTYPGSPQDVNNVEEYDGTSWTALSNLPAVRGMGYSFGTTTDAIVTGGRTGPPGASNTTLQWDGTSYTSFPTLSTARYNGGDGATTSSTAGLVVGGYITAASALTEEYNRSVNVLTSAAFSSGGAMPTAKSKVADGGTVTAAVAGGGMQNDPDSSFTSSAEYDGSSWAAGNALPANYGSVTGATGTQTALITGGKATGDTGTFEYDGTNWTAGGALGTGRYAGKNLGTQTAAAYCGGRVSPPTLNNVEEYDGSSWTSVTAMPIAIRNSGGFGIQTAGVVVSGFQGPASPPVSPNSSVSRGTLSFNYDGTNWTAGPACLIAGASGGAAGIQTVGFYLAGENPALSPQSIVTSQTSDGTTYRTDATTIRTSGTTGFGITSSRTSAVGTAAAFFGGTNPPTTPKDTAATEEYNVATSALNVKTITTS